VPAAVSTPAGSRETSSSWSLWAPRSSCCCLASLPGAASSLRCMSFPKPMVDEQSMDQHILPEPLGETVAGVGTSFWASGRLMLGQDLIQLQLCLVCRKASE
jgi:hypothetical protein